MANFCKQCADELDFDCDFTDLFKQNGDTPDGNSGFQVLCETCGPLCFIIDDEGNCGSPNCDGSLGDGGRSHG